MAVRALPVDHAMLHEEDDPSVCSCERYQSRTSEFFQHQRSDRKERHEQDDKCDLESLQWLHLFGCFGLTMIMAPLDPRNSACRGCEGSMTNVLSLVPIS